MIHMEYGPSTTVGVGLVSVGILLYALREREPHVSRDYDFLFSSIGLLCGGIFISQGWRLDPILLLSQMLLSGTAISYITESLYLRSIKNNITNLYYEKYKYFFINLLTWLKKKLIYQNFEFGMGRKKKPLYYGKWEGIYYTSYISCREKNRKQIKKL
uniref:Putative chloroplast RF66 n=1 Tax=Isoetes nuttallii TaxID=358751 RepID=A0A2U8KJ78_9TRAC|nr:putative chloroplast RF66 [Isoetes nuttallii]AWK92154.1 putative chloroplast RF66 [Isoetes nuttallii]